jgi:pimeloyl-ACP methyl ester carboxylesterase
MRRRLALALAILALLPARADTPPVSVAVTQSAPIEALDSSGNVTGVTESKVGDKYTFVSFNAGQVTLQDAQGNHFCIAASSTDYVPPATPAPAVANVATQTPPPAPAPASASTPPPASPRPSIPLPPVPPSALPSPPDTTASTPGSSLPADTAMQTLKIGDRTTANEMSVWPPTGIPDRPLLIAAHGNGGAGPREIKGWLKIARDCNFTIVCPSFLSSVNDGHLGDDEPYFNDCIKWIKDNLQYSHDNVFMVGFSGGGFPTWYLATKHPDFFRGLAFQSGNFAGGYYNLDLDKWFNRPIKLIWGSQDLADIPIQNQNAVDALKSADCKNYTTEIVPGGHHQEHPDLVVAWMEQNLAPPSDPASQ